MRSESFEDALRRLIAEEVRAALAEHKPAAAPAPRTERVKLTRAQVEESYGIKAKTLANWAALGTGPRYTKLAGGRVLYSVEELERWLRSQGK